MNQPRPSVPADQFGPYELFERLGMGGMATVHRAKKRGPQGFERSVALKRMLAHLAEDPTFVESFVREAKVASLLQHPNIAQIYDFGRIGGVYYIAMELVAGFDIRKLLRFANRSNEPIPLHVILSILGEMADALAYAHEFVDETGTPLHIVHRDISPSNLIVAHTGHLKVIDFGIAKAHSRQLHTESGAVKGKLGYMSPEAALGMSVGPVSDLFSMGVVAWELVTASPLFSARSDFETMRRIREADVVPPSQRNPACPAELDAIILSSLHRDADRRMPSASAFREALDHVAQRARIQPSARAVAEWMTKFAQPDDSWARSSASGRQRAPSHAPPPLPTPEGPTTNQRPRSQSQPPKLRRSEDDVRLATEIWGDDAAVAPTGAMPPDFDAGALGAMASHPSMQQLARTPSQPIPLSQPMPAMTAIPAHTQMGPPAATAKERSIAPWLLLVLLVGVAASLLTILLMRDKGAPATQPEAVAKADPKAPPSDEPATAPTPATPETPELATKSTAPTPATPEPAVATDDPPATDTPAPPAPLTKPERVTKRPPAHRPPAKRTGSVDKVVPEQKPPPIEVKPPERPVDPPKPPDKPIESVKPVEPAPPVKPVEPAKPARTAVVAATSVTKVAGEIPALRVAADDASVTAKLCIDEAGKVTSVKLVKAPADVSGELARALSSWRYKPYTNRDNKVSPACFVVSLRLVVK